MDPELTVSGGTVRRFAVIITLKRHRRVNRRKLVLQFGFLHHRWSEEVVDMGVIFQRRHLATTLNDHLHFPHKPVVVSVGVLPRGEGWSPDRIEARRMMSTAAGGASVAVFFIGRMRLRRLLPASGRLQMTWYGRAIGPSFPGEHRLLVVDAIHQRRGVIRRVNGVNRRRVSSSLMVVERTCDAVGLLLQRRRRQPPTQFRESLKLLPIVDEPLGL